MYRRWTKTDQPHIRDALLAWAREQVDAAGKQGGEGDAT